MAPAGPHGLRGLAEDTRDEEEAEGRHGSGLRKAAAAASLPGHPQNGGRGSQMAAGPRQGRCRRGARAAAEGTMTGT